MTLLESMPSPPSRQTPAASPLPTPSSPSSSSDQIFPNLHFETLTGSQTLIRPASGWRVPDLHSGLNDLLSYLCLNVKTKLKSPKSFSKGEFISLINSFFKKSSFKLQLQIVADPNPLDSLKLNFTLAAVEKFGVLISREVAGLIAEGCVVFEIWNLLESIVERNLVGNLNSYNLVEKLAEKNRTELVCLCVRKISNLRASEIYAVLKFFLSPSKDSYDGMVGIRKEWEKEALLAIEKVKEKGLPKKASILARDASILLMVAHDGFYSSEICLHYVFGSEKIDGLVLSSAISRLDGFEVMGLVRYFMKWLEKYERFPQARPSAACESIPSLEAVLNGLKVVFDEHFSYLVLNTEFRDELRKVESVVGSLMLEAELCCPVEDIVKHLKEIRKHEGLLQV